MSHEPRDWSLLMIDYTYMWLFINHILQLHIPMYAVRPVPTGI